MATNNDKQQQQQTEQSQPAHYKTLAAETPSIANPLGLPYNPLSHWGNVGHLRTPYTTYSRTSSNDDQQQQQQQQQAPNTSNSRKKSYEDKMDKQRLEHLLFSGDPSSLNQQKERMRQKLILKQNAHKNQSSTTSPNGHNNNIQKKHKQQTAQRKRNKNKNNKNSNNNNNNKGQRHCNGNNKRKSKQNKNKHKKNTHCNNNNGHNNKQNGKKKKKLNEKQVDNDALNAALVDISNRFIEHMDDVAVNRLNEDGVNVNNWRDGDDEQDEEEQDERESVDLIDAVDGMLEDESISINNDDDDDEVALKQYEIENRPVSKEMNKGNEIEIVSVDGKDIKDIKDGNDIKDVIKDGNDINDIIKDEKDVLLKQQREEIDGLKQRVFRLEKIVERLSNKLELMEESMNNNNNNNNNMDGIECKYDDKRVGSKRENSRSVGLSDDNLSSVSDKEITIKPETIDITSWKCIECNNGNNVDCCKCGAVKSNKIQPMSLLNKASISSTPSSNGNTTDDESDDTEDTESESISTSRKSNINDINNNDNDNDEEEDENGNGNIDVMKEIMFLKQRVNDIECGKLEIKGNNYDHEAVREWLFNQVKLGQYFQIFIANGFEDMLALKTLTMEILDNIKGIEKIGHKSRILYFVEKLNNIKEDNLDSTHEF